MKPERFTLAVLLCSSTLLPFTLSAQAPGGFGCGTDQARMELIRANPQLMHIEAQDELGLQHYLQVKAGQRADDDTVIYHIPVVFHVLFDPTATSDAHNVSDAQVHAAVNLLNTNYRKRNADTSEICCGFNAIAADSRIQFDLATKDPFGNCTNGIDRVQTQRSTLAGDFSKLNPWFRNNYLNIWVCNSIADAEVAGYAFYPSDVQDDMGALRDGVMIEYGSLVSFALVHEIGHYLNLQHVWGNNNDAGVACGDDGVADTPITKGYNLFCPGPDNCSICDPDIHENYQNYMDYSYCSVMYTNGQRDRMRATLNSNVSGRSNLWKENNRSYTGTADFAVNCGPQANFRTMDHFVCPGTPIQFKDYSTRATPTSWAWTFEGGSPATSDQQNPLVTFNEPGSHNVTLTVGNEYGSSSVTKNDVFLIGADYGQVNGLLNEPFNNINDFWQWPTLNWENNLTYWGWTDLTGHNAPGCAKLNGSQTYHLVQDLFTPNLFVDKDILLTPMLDMRFTTGAHLSFWYAYASQTGTAADITEELRVFSSNDCGKTWSLRTTISGGDLLTAGIASPGYIPNSNEWRQASFTIPSSYATNHVRFKFEYRSGLYSNDLYLDDVQITGTNVGIAETAQNGGFFLAPNPTTDHVSVTLASIMEGPGTIAILDMTGRTLFSQAVNKGEERLEIDLGKAWITSGVYLVQLKHAKGQYVERLVVR